MATLFAKGFFLEVKFLGQPQTLKRVSWVTSNPQTRNLTSGELQLEEILKLFLHLVHQT